VNGPKTTDFHANMTMLIEVNFTTYIVTLFNVYLTFVIRNQRINYQYVSINAQTSRGK